MVMEALTWGDGAFVGAGAAAVKVRVAVAPPGHTLSQR
jgi:hypothetical protein